VRGSGWGGGVVVYDARYFHSPWTQQLGCVKVAEFGSANNQLVTIASWRVPCIKFLFGDVQTFHLINLFFLGGICINRITWENV